MTGLASGRRQELRSGDDVLALVLFHKEIFFTAIVIRMVTGMANFSKNNVMKMKIGIVAIVLSVVCAIILVGRLFYLQIILKIC